ncbi:MAG: BlaI/MecI/CopY family transcriptional regulator [bacterium]
MLSERSGLRQVMGELEEEIMECVWERGPASVRDVHRCLLAKRDIAYTTVMTVMSRLAEKGLLVRHPEGRAFIYSARAPRVEYCAGVVKEFMDGMSVGASKPVLAHFIESLTADDAAQLDMLSEIIEEKRRERKQS